MHSLFHFFCDFIFNIKYLVEQQLLLINASKGKKLSCLIEIICFNYAKHNFAVILSDAMQNSGVY